MVPRAFASTLAWGKEVRSCTHRPQPESLAKCYRINIGLLRDQLPVERAIGEYLRAFYLSLGAGQLVLQRVKSEAAGSQLAAQYASGPAPDPELLEAAEEELPEVQPTEDAYTAPPSSALLG